MHVSCCVVLFVLCLVCVGLVVTFHIVIYVVFCVGVRCCVLLSYGTAFALYCIVVYVHVFVVYVLGCFVCIVLACCVLCCLIVCVCWLYCA